MGLEHELIASGIWLLKAYLITLVALGIAVWVLRNTTRWGRHYWELTGAWFDPRRSPGPLLNLALLLLLTLCGVRLSVLFSSWYNAMYTDLQKLNETGFWQQMTVFTALAGTHIVRALSSYYLQQAFVLRFRNWLNDTLLARWTDKNAFYFQHYLELEDDEHPATDNPDQRIQQDIGSVVTSSLSLLLGTVDALVSIVAYTGILWSLSGPLTLFGLTLSHGMVFAIYAYVLIATVFAFSIGRPLIRLNFLNEALNAHYRYGLVRMREYAESIAMYGGVRLEWQRLRTQFDAVIANGWAIVRRMLRFSGFNFIVGQTAAVFPFILQARRFFSGGITLGDMIQTSQAFGTLHDNLSFFRSAYDDFAGFRAVLQRLNGFSRAALAADALPRPATRSEGGRVALDKVTVLTPDGRPLASTIDLDMQPGQPLLIRGPSGSGKTTLLRTIAGLWPYSTGTIIKPERGVQFLPQRPYLPLGSLRDALYYPNPVPEGDDARARQTLIDIHLPHLLSRLDETADWNRILSLGEQQRLAFGRLLLTPPAAAFMDEATSAMDEELEQSLYRLIGTRLQDSVLVSVGHRSTLVPHHSRELLLDGQGGWSLSAR